MVSDCRLGKPRPTKQLEVDEDGFRKIKKLFQERVKGAKQHMSKHKDKVSTQPVSSSLVGTSQAIPVITEQPIYEAANSTLHVWKCLLFAP